MMEGKLLDPLGWSHQLLLAEVISLSENYLGCFPIRRLKCKTRWILRHS
uniref:Uncharacterized protein n=1 Tax=Aegilops tauschii subsp. strangulata TaxID=200361 RepID=A0A452XQL8_AEGTS